MVSFFCLNKKKYDTETFAKFVYRETWKVYKSIIRERAHFVFKQWQFKFCYF